MANSFEISKITLYSRFRIIHSKKIKFRWKCRKSKSYKKIPRKQNLKMCLEIQIVTNIRYPFEISKLTFILELKNYNSNNTFKKIKFGWT